MSDDLILCACLDNECCWDALASGFQCWRMWKATVEPECIHSRSELLAGKGDIFEMRKCLECARIFRVRRPQKASK